MPRRYPMTALTGLSVSSISIPNRVVIRGFTSILDVLGFEDGDRIRGIRIDNRRIRGHGPARTIRFRLTLDRAGLDLVAFTVK